MGFEESQSFPELEPQCAGSAKLCNAINLQSEALTVRISPDKEYCAVGQCNGLIKLFPLPHKSSKLNPLDLDPQDDTLPCTDMTFVPRQSDKRRLLAVYASGFVRLWQYTSGGGKANLWKFWKEPEYTADGEDEHSNNKFNQILCVSVSLDGKRFVTGGSDTVIRVYELQTSTSGRLLIPSIRTDSHNFHTNRITAIEYHPRGAKDVAFSHTFVSASWDGTIQGWDDRTCGSLWQYVGTNVAGADGLCIDSVRNIVLTGCYKHDKVLAQVWEAKVASANESKKSFTHLVKPLSQVAQDAGGPPTQIYVSRIAPDHQFIIFGGTNANIIKLVSSSTLRTLGSVTNLNCGVYSADSCSDPLDKKRFIVVFTNGLKIYFALVDPRQPTFSETANPP